jgi:hypothetical protein
MPYKGKPIKITTDLSTESLKAERYGMGNSGIWMRIISVLGYSIAFKIDGAIKIFHDKQKLKQYMTTKQPWQKILQGTLHTEDESKKNHKLTGNIKLQKKKR